MSRRAWARAVLNHVTASAPPWWPAFAKRLPIVALPWQFVPAMMVLSGRHRRLLLADEVGMGKTIQAGVLLHEVHAREPRAATLVIAPAGLVPQWAAELQQRARLEPVVLDASRLRREAAQPQALVDATRPGSCWLMSMDLLRQPDVMSLVSRTRWTLLVVDEAHAASPGTSRLEAVSQVAAASVRVLLLTATPAAGGAAAAEGLRRIGGRGREGPMPVLRRDVSLLARPRRRVSIVRVGLEGRHADLCARLDAFAERARRERTPHGLLPALVLRRRASSCPAALRRSLERRLAVLGSAAAPRTAGLFDALAVFDQDTRDDEAMRVPAWTDEDQERAELHRLLELVCRIAPPGRKLLRVARLVGLTRQPVVVFTAYLDTLRTLRALLPARGLVVVHGEQPAALRGHSLDAFAAGEATVLLATDAAAEGLNLQARCRLVVHAEVPPSWRIFEQRNGRVDRYGQVRRVHVAVMSSQTTEDGEALARVQVRGQSSEDWLSTAAPLRCRRSTVAERCLQTTSRQGDRTCDAEGDRDGPVPLQVCRLRPRRWRRLARRLGLPPGSTAVWAATLRAAGGPELSSSQASIVFAAAVPALPAWPDVAAQPPAPLTAHIVRASRLASQLARWEQEAASDIDAAAAPAPDLFADARAPSRPRRQGHSHTALWFVLDGVAVAATREPRR